MNLYLPVFSNSWLLFVFKYIENVTRDCITEIVNHVLAGFVAENECKKTFSLLLKTGSVYLHESDKIETKKINCSKVALQRQQKQIIIRTQSTPYETML